VVVSTSKIPDFVLLKYKVKCDTSRVPHKLAGLRQLIKLLLSVFNAHAESHRLQAVKIVGHGATVSIGVPQAICESLMSGVGTPVIP
jgi:hypothetical protein